MHLHRWTLGLAAAGAISLASAIRKVEGEKEKPLKVPAEADIELFVLPKPGELKASQELSLPFAEPRQPHQRFFERPPRRQKHW